MALFTVRVDLSPQLTERFVSEVSLCPVKLTTGVSITLTMSLMSENTNDLWGFYKQISANGELLTSGGVSRSRAGQLSMEDYGRSH